MQPNIFKPQLPCHASIPKSASKRICDSNPCKDPPLPVLTNLLPQPPNVIPNNTRPPRPCNMRIDTPGSKWITISPTRQPRIRIPQRFVHLINGTTLISSNVDISSVSVPGTDVAAGPGHDWPVAFGFDFIHVGFAAVVAVDGTGVGDFEDPGPGRVVGVCGAGSLVPPVMKVSVR
jgi:hypothetical protein